MQKAYQYHSVYRYPEQHEKLPQSSRASRMKRAPSWLHCTRRRISTATCRSKCRRRLHAVSISLEEVQLLPRSILSSRSLRRVSTTFPFASAPHATLSGADKVLDRLKQSSASSRECTPDGVFCHRVRRCIGACGLALVLSPSTKTFYGRLVPEDVEVILAKYTA